MLILWKNWFEATVNFSAFISEINYKNNYYQHSTYLFNPSTYELVQKKLYLTQTSL